MPEKPPSMSGGRCCIIRNMTKKWMLTSDTRAQDEHSMLSLQLR